LYNRAVDEKTDPSVKVVDRRWWARTEEERELDDAASTKPSYVEELEKRVADHAAQLQTYATEHRRAIEEFEQARMRIRRDVTREVERGKRAVLAELLDVLDNLDRAIAAGTGAPAGNDALLRGVELVRDQFTAKLAAFGVSRVPALGEPFDALRHEAVATAPVTEPARNGIIVAVVKEGYAIGDELLRPASVVVGELREQS
jgi:molecular chaperone GrpE